MVLKLLHSLLDGLVIECWLQVQEVPGSIPSQGPRHTKDVIKMVPVVPLINTENPSKSEVISRCGEDEKKSMTTQNRHKSNAISFLI